MAPPCSRILPHSMQAQRLVRIIIHPERDDWQLPEMAGRAIVIAAAGGGAAAPGLPRLLRWRASRRVLAEMRLLPDMTERTDSYAAAYRFN